MIEQPPVHAVMPQLAQTIAIPAFALIAAGFLFWALIKLVRDKDPTAIYLWIGGFISAVWEPILELLGHAYHPVQGQIVGYTLFGRSIPLHALFFCPTYFGGVVGLLYYRIARGVDWTWTIKTWGGLAVIAPVAEIIPLDVGMWMYYGSQPLKIFGFPIWWCFVNPAAVMVMASLLFMARGMFQGAMKPLLILAVPISMGAGWTTVSWPMWVALNMPLDESTSRYVATVPATLLTLIVVLLVLRATSNALVAYQKREVGASGQ